MTYQKKKLTQIMGNWLAAKVEKFLQQIAGSEFLKEPR